MFALDDDYGYKDEDHIQKNLYIFLFTDFACWKTN